MSAKYANKKKRNGKRTALWVIIAVLAVVLALAVLLGWGLYKTEEPDPMEPAASTEPTGKDTPATEPMVQEVVLNNKAELPVTLDERLEITDIGEYTGIFMEDGSDEVVSGVLMLVVKNTGEQAVQYAEITLPTDNGEAKFTLSTLPAGESVVLLEQSRMAYNGKEEVSQAAASNVAVFPEALSLAEDKLQLQVLDGALNVTNISGGDITGDVVIYYKNAASDLYYGGITYRVRIEGGIKADEIKQIMASHFSDTGSKIMFVTVG